MCLFFTYTNRVESGPREIAPISIKSLPLNWNAISKEAVPVEGVADIAQDGTVDLHLKTSLSRLGGRQSRAEDAAEKLEPIVPHYLNLTQPYTTKSQQKYYTWAGKPGQTAPPSRYGDYNVGSLIYQLGVTWNLDPKW